MASTVVEAEAHTASDGFLRLNLTVGVPDADVTVTVCVVSAKAKWPTANGWPEGFFDEVAGSMPTLERPPQGEFEQRKPLP